MTEEWTATIKQGTRVFAMAGGNEFLRSKRVDKEWSDMTWKEKIGKKYFGGRYFYPNAEDIFDHFEKMRGK